jgi:hypothetical protein
MTPTRALIGLAVVAAAGYAVINSTGGAGPKYLGDMPSIMAQASAAPRRGARRSAVGARRSARVPEHRTMQKGPDRLSGALRAGVSDGARTRDTQDHNLVLYRLSYTHHAAARPGTGTRTP